MATDLSSINKAIKSMYGETLRKLALLSVMNSYSNVPSPSLFLTISNFYPPAIALTPNLVRALESQVAEQVDSQVIYRVAKELGLPDPTSDNNKRIILNST